MRAVFFGTFNSTHAANVLIAEDLRQSGVELRICHKPLWQQTREKPDSYFSPRSLVRLFFRWLWVSLQLALQFRYAAAGAEVVVVGFNGQLDVLLARLLAGRRQVVFVPLVTLSETLVDDRRVYRAGSLAARFLGILDRLSLRAADFVVIDTYAHANYLRDHLQVPAERIRVHYLGAESVFSTERSPTPGVLAWPTRPRLRILSYASYLPLHGMEVVAAAAEAIRAEEGLAFLVVGSGPERARVEERFRELPHVILRDWMSQTELFDHLRGADVVLGIFGSSAKANMVIPNKVYQAAQMGCPIVTADTPAIREIFTPGESVFSSAANGEALAAELRVLAGDSERRVRVGAAGKVAAASVAGPRARADQWRITLGISAESGGEGA